jgi:predicted Zn-dependent protease
MKIKLIAVVVLFVLSMTLVYLGQIDGQVGLTSVFEVWGDVMRDADQFGFKLTRVSEKREMEIGAEIAGNILCWWAVDPTWETYVGAVGKLVEQNVSRRGIVYKYHVLKSGSCLNAFALPGGEIFITTGMLELISFEAELAAILGHEIAHVDLRHCIEQKQYQELFRKAGLREIGQLVELLKGVATRGYNKYQELDADEDGLLLTVRAGYDGRSAIDFYSKLQNIYHGGERTKAKTPDGELTQSLEDALTSYYATYPITAERINRLQEIIRKQGSALGYKGALNYQRRISKKDWLEN